MSEMNTKQELKTLRQMSKLLRDEDRETKRQTTIRRAIYALTWVALVAAFVLVRKVEGTGVIAVATAAFAGIFAGVAMYWGSVAKQWPALRPHINNESIAARIKQLETRG
jgi:hypothetical protein